MPINNVYLMDCLQYMKSCKENQFNLSICDPPYGIGECGGDKKRNRNCKRIVKHEKKTWDYIKPDKEYFNELFRISRNQIIFGANYFVENLYSSMGWVFWDKRLGGDFSDGELLFTSFNKAFKLYSLSNFHGLHGGHDRIHPTEKPTKLYKWLLKNYAKEGDKIFDSHVGSGSIRIACHELGFDFEGCELDKDYWEAQELRYQNWLEKYNLEQNGYKVNLDKKTKKINSYGKLLF